VSWPKKKRLVVSGHAEVVRDAADLVHEACYAFSEHDYAKGAALAAASVCGLAQLAKFTLPDKGACSDCGHHVCSCEAFAKDAYEGGGQEIDG